VSLVGTTLSRGTLSSCTTWSMQLVREICGDMKPANIAGGL
jgi:hypothetical protein